MIVANRKYAPNAKKKLNPAGGGNPMGGGLGGGTPVLKNGPKKRARGACP